MNPKQSRSVAECFAVLNDARRGPHKLHSLQDVLVIALCATVCGATSYYDMEAFGTAREGWLRESLGLELPNGIPSHDTFNRVFQSLDPALFEACFRLWIDQVRQSLQGEVVAVDGKALKSVPTPNGSTPYVVSAWASAQELVIGQVRTDEKSNEIKAIPQLLDLLRIKGAIVTIDAAGCQKAIVAKIVEKGADYVIGLKGNQPTMLEEMSLMFDDALKANPGAFRRVATVEKQSGRVEERTCCQTSDIDWFADKGEWAGLRSVCRVDSKRTVRGVESRETRHCISSLEVAPVRTNRAIRAHWGIENKVHWLLDVEFGEDDSRVRKINAAQNLNTLRKFAIDLIRRDKTTNRTFKKKRQQLMWDDAMLRSVVVGK